MSSQDALRSNIIAELKKYENDLDALLEDILTPKEIVDINERIALFHGLANGETQRNIAEKLKISVTTVSRGSRIIQYGRLKEKWRN